jgi:3-oxoacyl-[acyl-carrier protein] reductase
MNERLGGKVALVTGGGTGIGRATALALAAEGAAVAVNYSRSRGDAEETASEIVSRGGRAITAACDISDERGVDAMIARVAGELGQLDVLVNNAGTTTFIDHRNLEALTADVWDRILAVNVKGTFFCSRAAARAMTGGGRIINIGSVAGVRGNGSSIAYAASKAAIHTMTLSLARALAPSITVNAIAPGLIETRWHGGHDAENAARAARFPAKRIGRPEDIAHMAVAFATADNFLTGQVIVVDGGALL